MVVGTPAFLSPEQLGNDSPVGPASDIFSLGSVLAFAATGRAPFEVGDLSATMYAIVNRPPILRLAAGPLLDILTACLAKDPAGRPTAAALLTYLYRTRSSQFPDPGATAMTRRGEAAGRRPIRRPGSAPARHREARHRRPGSVRAFRQARCAPPSGAPARLRRVSAPPVPVAVGRRGGPGSFSPGLAVPGAGAARAVRMAAGRLRRGGALARLRQRGRDHHVVAGRVRPAGAVLAGRGGGARHDRRPR